MTVKIIVGDALESLKKMPDKSVHCCITSPPYFGLRDYGVIGQMGLEATPEQFISSMVEVFREVRRVLRDDGTCWVNMGDSYAQASSRKAQNNSLHDGKYAQKDFRDSKYSQGVNISAKSTNLKPKDLMGMPWRLALAMQADGWYLRSDIIWAKPNPMPESVTDRPTKAHEYVFLFSKSAQYFYDNDAVREENSPNTHPYGKKGKFYATPNRRVYPDEAMASGFSSVYRNPAGRNRRTVWSIATQPYKEAHFATFPTKLVEPMIKAGTSEKGCCPECGGPWVRVTETRDPNNRLGKGYHDHTNDLGRGQRGVFPADGAPTKHTTGWQPSCDHNLQPIPCTVLDNFAGACTTGLVADRLGRDAIMLELNPEYAEMGRQRIANDAGWVSEVETVDDAPHQMGMFDA